MTSANKVPIQSVARAMAVLEVLARKSGGVGLVELGRSVGLHKATVFRLLRTMMLLGYVVQAGDRKLYSISAAGSETCSETGRLPRAADRAGKRPRQIR